MAARPTRILHSKPETDCLVAMADQLAYAEQEAARFEAAHENLLPVDVLTREEYDTQIRAGAISRIPNVRPGPAGTKHMVIPDTQQKPGADNSFMYWLGLYAAEKMPDRIIHLGDHWDMPSLSLWDTGKAAAENRRYWYDIHAGNAAMDLFEEGLATNEHYGKGWCPTKDFLIGNHEYRIQRWLESSPAMQGVVGYHHFNLVEHGWDVHDFLFPIWKDGVKYSHFHPRGPSGKITQTKNGAPNARLQVMREGASCTAGHQQGLDVYVSHIGPVARRGIIAGSCYTHEESYLIRAEGNSHWRGFLMKHEVHLGNYSLMEVSLDYLRRKYGGERP